jgi:hypothetical protein
MQDNNPDAAGAPSTLDLMKEAAMGGIGTATPITA